MDEKALDALRNGLEDSYWYGDDDEKVFNELVRKAKAFDESLKGFKKLERLHEEVQKSSKRHKEKSGAYKETLTHVISKMESDLGESGEME